MKKFMTAVTAVSLSAMMLAGCGKADVQQESTVQESTAAETGKYPAVSDSRF